MNDTEPRLEQIVPESQEERERREKERHALEAATLANFDRASMVNLSQTIH